MMQELKHPVLLVDDEPDMLFSLKGLLRHDFVLYTAESAREGLQILAEHPIHVVMTDQRMPEMTGVEMLGKVRSQYPDAIRIVFTGYADIKAVVDAINKGGLYRYITKPWDPDELIEVLHAACARYDELVERKHLMIDLRTHLAKTQNAESGVPAELHVEGVGLLDRLDSLIRREVDWR